MDQIHVREGNSEVLVYIDRYLPTKLLALQEAAKILQREIIRVASSDNNHFPR